MLETQNVLLRNSKDVQLRATTDSKLALKVYNLNLPHNCLAQMVNRVMEPAETFSKGILQYGTLTQQTVNSLWDQRRFQEEDDELERKCQRQKAKAISDIISEVQVNCQEQLQQNMLDTFVKRNVQVVTFICDYLRWVGIPTQHAERVLLLPYEGALYLNVFALFYLMKRYYSQSISPLPDGMEITMGILKQHTRKFFHDYQQFFPVRLGTERKEKVNVGTWFSYEVLDVLLPSSFQDTSLEKQAMAGCLRLCYADLRQWMTAVPSRPESKSFFEFFVNKDGEKKTSAYQPLVLPLEKNAYRAVFEWPLCKEIVKQLDWVTLRQEFKSILPVPVISEGNQMGMNWKIGNVASVDFPQQLSQELQIPSNFFFSLPKNAGEMLPRILTFPLSSDTQKVLSQFRQEVSKVLKSSTDVPLMELSRIQFEQVCRQLASYAKAQKQKKKNLKRLRQNAKRSKGSRKKKRST